MYLRNNPVLERELLLNLRTLKAFVLQLVYVVGLGTVVVAAWPAAERIDMTRSTAATRLVDLFFLGQFVLASLMAPSFAAGAIAGEKERKSYEMLLASPLRPGAIVLGKLLASWCPLGLLVVSSLPVVMLCLPLGGVSLYEVLVAYAALLLAVTLFTTISLTASSYFRRTSHALVVSYLVILPLSMVGAAAWAAVGSYSSAARLATTATFLPLGVGAACLVLLAMVSRRLLRPPDVGSEGHEVHDEARELRQTVGMVIQRHEFPDRLFAPPKRSDLLPDGANPVFDKELQSEVLGQGTLTLRLVIQISMLLAVPLMFGLYFLPASAPWYVSYVLVFNGLVGPVFSAGSVTSERERETLDLLLVTLLRPGEILVAKLWSGLRVSSVLTLFLVWPLALAGLLVPEYHGNVLVLLGYLGVILVTSLTTSMVALAHSVALRRTSVSTMATYLVLLTLFTVPPAVQVFSRAFWRDPVLLARIEAASFTSPFSVAFALPLEIEFTPIAGMNADELQVAAEGDPAAPAFNATGGTAIGSPDAAARRLKGWRVWGAFVAFYLAVNAALFAAAWARFARRSRFGE